MIQFPLPLIGLCAYSGTGKTTLLTQLIPRLRQRGLRTGVVKHAHHDFDIDHPGKDSYEIRQAGAEQVAIASHKRIAWIKEIPVDRNEPALSDALAALDINDLDLVIAEGFKSESFAKIELHRPGLGKPLLYTKDNNIIALATDADVTATPTPQLLDLNNVDEIAEFIISYVNKHNSKAPTYATWSWMIEHHVEWKIKETLINSEFPQHMDVLPFSVAGKPLKMKNQIKSH